MQGLRAGPVLEALRPGGTVPQANPTTPPRRQREPSPSTPGDNKRQSRRLKAGQQALAGLTLGSLPVSASDNPEVWTPTQRTGETDELRGGTLSPEPWAHHCMEIGSVYHLADHARPKSLRQGHVPPDGLQTAPPKRWRGAPWTRPLSKAAAMGAKICVLTSPWGDKLQESLSLGFPEDLLEDIRQIQADQLTANPSSWTSCTTTSFPGSGARGPTAGHGPTSDLAGHLATQEGAERGGAGVLRNSRGQ